MKKYKFMLVQQLTILVQHMEKEWKDITNYFSEKQRHYNGKYLVVDYLLDEEIEVQLYEVEEE